MRITFYGGAREVTGAKYLVAANGHQLLLDCGAHQGRRQESRIKNSAFSFDPAKIEAVVISHAHFDHIGMLPQLVKGGFKGLIYSTAATRDLAELILLDAAHLQVQEAAYVNRHNLPESELSQPLYTPVDIPAVMKLFRSLPYGQTQTPWPEILPGISVKLYEAGHILGSAVTVLKIREPGSDKYLGYSGDLGRFNQPLIRDPQTIAEKLDLFMVEATYGDRLNHPRDQVEAKLIELVGQIVRDRGRIIVPAFSMGRTQQLIYILHNLTDAGRLPRIPIYVDSPLSNRITAVYQQHQRDYDNESHHQFSRPNEDPLAFRNLNYLRTVEQSKGLNDTPGPWIVISASGMITGGRVMHHLRRHISDPKTIVLLTGYQADHTPGRRLLKGARTLRIFGDDVPVAARIEKVNDLSAHADAATLLYYARQIPEINNIAVIHSEVDRAEALMKYFQQQEVRSEIFIPTPNQTVDI